MIQTQRTPHSYHASPIHYNSSRGIDNKPVSHARAPSAGYEYWLS